MLLPAIKATLTVALLFTLAATVVRWPWLLVAYLAAFVWLVFYGSFNTPESK